MKVHATNISRVRLIEYQGKTHETGIFKRPVAEPLEVSGSGVTSDVIGDEVSVTHRHAA